MPKSKLSTLSQLKKFSSMAVAILSSGLGGYIYAIYDVVFSVLLKTTLNRLPARHARTPCKLEVVTAQPAGYVYGFTNKK